MKGTNVLVTILGRGGSKGLPGKNVRPFLGAPLIGFSIYDALQSLRVLPAGGYKSLAIDSDSYVILDTAAAYLKEDHILHLRDAALAEDATPKTAAIHKLLHDVEKQQGILYDVVIDLDITSPLRTADDILRTYNHLTGHPFLDLVFTVVPARRNPYFNMVEPDEDGIKVRLVREGNFTCRQDAPKVFEMNASVYAYRAGPLRDFQNLLFDLRSGMAIMRDYGVLDIDSLEDHELMELIYKEICIPGDEYFHKKLIFAKK